jgi:hypothetical protein
LGIARPSATVGSIVLDAMPKRRSTGAARVPAAALAFGVGIAWSPRTLVGGRLLGVVVTARRVGRVIC